MTLFIFLCVAMSAVALTLVARPLFKIGAISPALIAIAVLLPVVAVGVYWKVGHRTWERDQATAQEQIAAQHDIGAMIARLEQRVREAPNDVDAKLALAETLVGQDERAITGRAGELFEAALKLAPNNTRALWYGAISALSSGKLPLARERLQRVLLQNPPDNIRSIIERQIQDIGQQLGEKQADESTQTPITATRTLDVQVSLQPKLAANVDKSTSLFVLARDPTNGGPPLAVVRRTVGDLPLNIKLSDSDAMIAGHGISSVARVQIVARISKTGAPLSQPGDLYGDATLDLATVASSAKPIAVKIVIDRQVEK